MNESRIRSPAPRRGLALRRSGVRDDVGHPLTPEERQLSRVYQAVLGIRWSDGHHQLTAQGHEIAAAREWTDILCVEGPDLLVTLDEAL